MMNFFAKFYKRIPERKVIDISSRNGNAGELYNDVIVDYPDCIGANRTVPYLGHPDSVLLDDGRILVVYPKGHGKGETIIKESSDGGKTWSERYTGLPETFLQTEETPTIYKLDFVSGDQKLILISGRPGWGKLGNGFDAALSVSKDEFGHCNGKIWLPHEHFFGTLAERKEYYREKGEFEATVAMASLTHLKENGVYADKWMGIFHVEKPFRVFKSFLSFNKDGEMEWTAPQKVLTEPYEKEERKLRFCEPEVVRSPDGGELAMLFRTNAKISTSRVSFSKDEGKTWGRPEPLSRELSGERHKAEYDPVTGKLIITFRAIDWFDGKKLNFRNQFWRGWVAWVGDYEDLHKGADGKGDYTIKLAHTYLSGQRVPQVKSNADTGYAGLTIDKDGNAVVISYGRFSPDKPDSYIVAKRFNISKDFK